MLNKMSKLDIKLFSYLAVSSLLLFNACSSVSSNTGDQEGQLIDSAVQGVSYETDSGITGRTNENGTFTYDKTDKVITFAVGDLIIAKNFALSSLNSDSKILPADIVGVDRSNTTDEKVIKLLRVLQSLDTDNNPNNGILIDDITKSYLGENVSLSDTDISIIESILQNIKNIMNRFLRTIQSLYDSNPDDNIFLNGNSNSINIIDADIAQLKTVVETAQKTLKNQKESRLHYIKTLISMNIDPDLMPFTTVWKTSPEDMKITIPINSKYTYNYKIDWGDGNITNGMSSSATHAYDSVGNHTVKISGIFPAIRMVSNKNVRKKTTTEMINAKKLQTITQWGDIAWSSFQNAFAQCSQLDVTATDSPVFSDVSSARGMFYLTNDLEGNKYFNNWDVSHVSDMGYMFAGTDTFNQPLNNWDVSNVSRMDFMFTNSRAFNQPLNNWNVSHVNSMSYMFANSRAFNQPLESWDVSNVTSMNNMFWGAVSFNQALNNWNVSKVARMDGMFRETKAFNQALDNWDVSHVIRMDGMFWDANVFNQALNSWDVSGVANMRFMFTGASAFKNQDLSNWNADNVQSIKRDRFMADTGGGNTEPSWKQ